MTPRLIVLWLVLCLTSGAEAATRYVCPSGCAYNRIQSAINAARSGDIIAIGDGTYAENLEIEVNNLVLQGSSGSPAAVIVQGNDNSVKIDGNNVTLENLTVNVTGANTRAIKIEGNNVILRNLAVNAPNASNPAIKVEGSGASIDRVSITGNDKGIEIEGNNFTITAVDIANLPSYGIDIAENASGSIRDSRIRNTGDKAIHADGRANVSLSGNCLMSGRGNNAGGFSGSSYSFSGNFWSTAAGVQVTPDYPDSAARSSCPFAASLIAHYRFDDTWSGSDLLDDSSGRNKHATLRGTVTQESAPAANAKPDTCKAGNFNKAGWFATPAGLDIDTAANAKNSVSFWMYWDGGFHTQNFTMPFSWGGVYYDLAVSKYRSNMGAGVIGFNTGNGDVYGVTAAGLANGWHHVAAVFNNGDVTKSTLYLDGVQKSLTSYAGQNARSATTSAGIGAGAGWGGDYKWSGKLDNLKIYKGTISSAQIAADMVETVSCAGAPSGPAALNAVDVGANAVSGQIATKTAGAAFSLDIYALNAARTAQDSAATGDVLLDLLANNATGVARDANNCPTSGTTLSVGTVTLAAGKVTAAMGAVANSWRDVRVRMRYPATGAATVTACSADNFAVKPATLSAIASHADWQTAGSTLLANTGASGGAIHKAGRPFSVRVTGYNASNAITSNYDGSPTASSACVLPASGCVAGAFNAGAFSASAGTAASSTASYSEAGAIAATFSDTGYASVDSDDTAASCAGFHVCASAIDIGRFVPDHFDISANTPTFTPACGTFSYLGQPFGFGTGLGASPVWTVIARNYAGATTLNYTGSLFKLAAGTVSGQAWSAASGTLAVVGSLPAVSVSDLGSGQGSLVFSVGDPAGGGGLAFARTALAAPFDASLTLAASVADSEGVIHAGNPWQHSGIGFDDANAATATDAQFRFGRLRLSHAVGSELLPLPVPLTAQYWNGQGFVANTADNCTALTTPSLTFYTASADNHLASGETTASFNATLAAGNGNLRLSAPGGGNFGYLDLVIGAPNWLKYNWDGVDQGGDVDLFDDNPRARVAFGKRKGADKVIIRREIY
ncbi:MAG: LamG-like jellyroll fold domain-containing protein [Pseudomonadota bacterium]|nr:LamG-like jellyroll fold domain-containing protein [Pseudomonadota bacterium]